MAKLSFSSIAAYIRLLSFIIFLYGCTPDRSNKVPPTIKPYIEEFVSEASKRGIHIEAGKLEVVFKNNLKDPSGKPANGKCIQPFFNLYAPRIELDTTKMWWRGYLADFSDYYALYSTSERVMYAREKVIFHELAHCFLDREHTFDTLFNGLPVSIMGTTSLPSYDNNPLFREYYLEELFNQQLPVPCLPDTNTIISANPSEAFSSLRFTYLRGILRDKQGQIWVSSLRTLAQISAGSKSFFIKKTYDLPGNIHLIRTDNKGRIWLSTSEDNKLDIYYIEDGKLIRYKVDSLLKEISFIHDFSFDKQGFLWLATDQGLVCVENESTYTLMANSFLGLSTDFVVTIKIDNRDNKWLATNKDKFFRLTDKDTSLVYQNPYSATSVNFINSSIYIDAQDNVWATTSSGQLLKYNHKQGKLEVINLNINDCGYPVQVNALQEDVTGTAWVAFRIGSNYGLANLVEGKINCHFTLKQKNLDTSNRLNQFLFYQQGVLWILDQGMLKEIHLASTL